MLTWNQTDVLACLGVEPEVAEYQTQFVYRVERDGLRLELSIHPYAGDILMQVFRDGVVRPVFHARLIGCQGLRYVNDDRGEYLEFAPAKCFGSRYDGQSPIPYGVRISVAPSIAVTLF